MLATPVAEASADQQIDLRTSGGLTATWHGDPARGCAAAGVCDVAGSVTLTPQEGEGTTVSSSNGSLVDVVTLNVENATARVLRGPADHPAGACLDAAGSSELSLGSGSAGNGRVRVALVSFDFPEGGPLSAGRCAGPLPIDLARALPVVTMSSRALRARNVTLDFRGARPFTGGAFSGTVRSTLVMHARVSHPKRESSVQSGRASPVPVRRRVAILELTYRATAASDPLTLAYGPAPARPCDLLDACGLAATETLTLTRAPGIELFARVPVRGRQRPTVASALAALHAGRADDITLAPTSENLQGRLTVDATRNGAPACRDTRTVRLPTLLGDIRARHLAVSLGAAHYAEPEDPLRTRCTGPARDADRDGALAAGRLDLARLGDPPLGLRLTPRPIGDGDFASRLDGALVVDLERTQAKVLR